MSTTVATPVADLILKEDFGVLPTQPTVYVLSGFYIHPAYVTRHPAYEHDDYEVVYQRDVGLGDLTFGPARHKVWSRYVFATELEAKRALLQECWSTAERLIRDLAEVAI